MEDWVKPLRVMFEHIAEGLQVSISDLPQLVRKRKYNLRRYTLKPPAHFKKVHFEEEEKRYNPSR